jgi:hypothetical protein
MCVYGRFYPCTSVRGRLCVLCRWAGADGARRLVGRWAPRFSVRQGIEETVRYFRHYYGPTAAAAVAAAKAPAASSSSA